MDLWIRSQDRECLMKVNRVDKYGLSIVTFDNEYREIYLGNYATEERTLEVLDEIQKYMLNGSFAKITNGLGEIIELKPNPIFVYEMPKE